MTPISEDLIDRIVSELMAALEYEDFLNTHDLENLSDEEQNRLLELYQAQKETILDDAGQ